MAKWVEPCRDSMHLGSVIYHCEDKDHTHATAHFKKITGQDGRIVYVEWLPLKDIEVPAQDDQTCHCNRDADGRCIQCANFMFDVMSQIASIAITFLDRMEGWQKEIGRRCIPCRLKYADFALARAVRESSKIHRETIKAMTSHAIAIFKSMGVEQFPLLAREIKGKTKT